MPGDSVGALLEELGAGAVICAAEDEVDFWEALGCTGGLVNVVTAEVAGVFDGVLDREGGEVLVTEGWIGVWLVVVQVTFGIMFVRVMWAPTDDTSLGDIQSELVLASLGKLA